MAKTDRVVFVDNGASMEWTFPDNRGTVAFPYGVAVAEWAKVPAPVQQAARHGWKQKIADSGAVQYKKDYGVKSPEQVMTERITAMAETASRLTESGGESWQSVTGGTTLLAMAVAVYLERRGQPFNAEKFRAKTKEQLADLAAHPEIIEILAAQKAAKVSPDAAANAEAMLDDMS